MSRTYRNRRTVPKGVVVRDDGVVYYPCCPNKRAQRESWKDYRKTWLRSQLCPCHAHWNQRFEFRRGIYRTEKKAYRKAHYRQYRAKVKDRMRHEDWENIPRHRRTGGWLTW